MGVQNERVGRPDPVPVRMLPSRGDETNSSDEAYHRSCQGSQKGGGRDAVQMVEIIFGNCPIRRAANLLSERRSGRRGSPRRCGARTSQPNNEEVSLRRGRPDRGRRPSRPPPSRRREGESLVRRRTASRGTDLNPCHPPCRGWQGSAGAARRRSPVNASCDGVPLTRT